MRKDKSYFHFKQFSIDHSRCSMKVGTDGVVLGAWVNVEGAARVLDVGTGSGLIALMLAQRCGPDTLIDAVELCEADAQQAQENVRVSRWPAKVKIYATAVQQFHPASRYDLIVSNPPFFMNSHLPPLKSREQVRHTSTLPFEELLSSVVRLLTEDGRCSVILPPAEGTLFTRMANQYGLFCTRRWEFYARAHKPAERLLLEFAKADAKMEEGRLIMFDGDDWSDDYKRLTSDFYLRL
jgi:tRNA1Val (adenine37-N6)-methyltransferase